MAASDGCRDSKISSAPPPPTTTRLIQHASCLSLINVQCQSNSPIWQSVYVPSLSLVPLSINGLAIRNCQLTIIKNPSSKTLHQNPFIKNHPPQHAQSNLFHWSDVSAHTHEEFDRPSLTLSITQHFIQQPSAAINSIHFQLPYKHAHSAIYTYPLLLSSYERDSHSRHLNSELPIINTSINLQRITEQ